MSGLVVLQLAALLIALLVLIGAVVYRQLRRRATERYFTAELQDADPVVRISAVTAWSEFGLYRCSPSLLALARRETDPAVKLAIADAIRARSWEPDSTTAVDELRKWCAAYRLCHDETSPKDSESG